MDYEIAKDRLWNHANLPETGLPIEESLVGCLFLANKGHRELSFQRDTEDVLDCLKIVNLEMNGPNPNEAFGPPKKIY
jgi:hypothetical protein